MHKNTKIIIFLLSAILISCSNCDLKKEQAKNKQANEALTLSASYEKVNENDIESYRFDVKAKRNKVVEGEYFPSSQTIALTITDEYGKMLYNSSMGTMFMDIIETVYPENISEEHTYSIIWNGKDMKGNHLPNGKYKAMLLLPAIPNPYATDIEMEIE
ncbi:MAG: hypothetical protein B7C24_10435 [Bacteroidetes bacterium 4572_77]|nr:MAG: hypothetical protein B7C24_10435 [Bacteroidetes bacterium 4572_77]